MKKMQIDREVLILLHSQFVFVFLEIVWIFFLVIFGQQPRKSSRKIDFYLRVAECLPNAITNRKVAQMTSSSAVTLTVHVTRTNCLVLSNSVSENESNL